MKKTIFRTTMLLVVLAITQSARAEEAEIYSGICPANAGKVQWSLDTGTGILTITGTGELSFWDANTGRYEFAWSAYRDLIRTVEIGEGVTGIGHHTFEGCKALASVSIPESMTCIGDLAFSGCSSLTSITIPNGVTSIGERTFAGCSSLSSMVVGDCNMQYNEGKGANCIIETATNTLMYGCAKTSIPAGVTSIGDRAFMGCASLTSIAIPDGVTSIGDGAFSGCSGLTSITLPGSVTSIGELAFADCERLASIALPTGITSIGDWAFSGCTGLASLALPDEVTNIGGGLFSFCTGLTSATLPDGADSIGNFAFYDCPNLTSISTPNSMSSIGDWAFNGCSGLSAVSVQIVDWANNNVIEGITDSYTTLSRFSFNYFYEGKEVRNCIIPEDVEEVDDYILYKSPSLESVEVSNTMKSLGKNAFSDCPSLNRVTMNIVDWANENVMASYKVFSDLPFTYVYQGDEVGGDYMIPDGVETIGKQALYQCTSLTTLHFPASVNKIELNAFRNCENLAAVYVSWETPIKITAKSVFSQKSNGTILADLYVPEGTLELYKSANIWKKFQNIQEYDATGVCDLSIDNKTDVIYNLQGQKVTNTKAGQIYIKAGNKVLMK